MKDDGKTAQGQEHSSHTPGPWTAECVGFGGAIDNPVDVYEITINGRRVAEYLYEGDARLIAAAPDLLEAVYEALEFAEDQEDVIDGNDGPRPNRAMQLATTLRLAIVKARGER